MRNEGKHGHWIVGFYKEQDVRKCSLCGITQTVTVHKGVALYKFCPYCGGYMDGEVIKVAQVDVESRKKAIEKLGEVSDYNDYLPEVVREGVVDAVSIAINDMNKQIPKKTTHEATVQRCHTCPTCKNVVGRFEKWGESTVLIHSAYCEFCGQALKFV